MFAEISIYKVVVISILDDENLYYLTILDSEKFASNLIEVRYHVEIMIQLALEKQHFYPFPHFSTMYH